MPTNLIFLMSLGLIITICIRIFQLARSPRKISTDTNGFPFAFGTTHHLKHLHPIETPTVQIELFKSVSNEMKNKIAEKNWWLSSLNTEDRDFLRGTLREALTKTKARRSVPLLPQN